MNVNLPFIPDRPLKPRQQGITMMMDKGLSAREAENFVASSAEVTDLVKFGFGTSLIAKDIERKIQIYREASIRPYFGGTLFELFVVRGMFDEFRKFIHHYKLDLVEISDGSILLPHKEKLEYTRLLSRDFTVVSEVGSKMSGVHIPDEKWVESMHTELQAGAWKVIAEARESGTSGIFNQDGSADSSLIHLIVDKIGGDKVIWEAPNKDQQVWFISLLGANVNLGNIATSEVIPLECLRLGLRGDTFFHYLPEEMKAFQQI